MTLSGKKIDCDCLVVGGGIAGMTISLLLARSGARVILMECAQEIGGSMRRFFRDGVPFDTGFHFTAGLNGPFGDLLRFAGLADDIETIPVQKCFYFSQSGKQYEPPRGRLAQLQYLQHLFPEYAGGLSRLFDDLENIWRQTVQFSPDGLLIQPDIDANHISLLNYIRQFHFPPELEVLIGSFGICCCGTPAGELSAAAFCRIDYGLQDDLVRFKNGGETLICSFKNAASKTDVQILTDRSIVRCVEDQGTRRTECHEIITNQGETIRFKDCIMTIHPGSILNTISPLLKNDDFKERVSGFEESCGYFTSWGILDHVPGKATVTSCFARTDLETLLSPAAPENTSAGILLNGTVCPDGRERGTVTIFENVFPAETVEWAETRTGDRSASYQAYKMAKQSALEEKLYECHPSLKGQVRFVESASQLTYRDYLSPFGSAYGIRQKMNQFNIFGRLPVRNFYACGQNSLLPGAFGAMLSSCILWRKLTARKTGGAL